MKRISLILLPFICVTFACGPRIQATETMQLALSTENSVEVIISTQRDGDHEYTLLATYTPLEPGMHLYSKDIPRDGFDGLGRPTLLELAPDSAFQILGNVQESVASQPPDSEPLELFVYPPGPVTLSLPVQLSNSNTGSIKVYVTYMACDDKGCRAPVENKAIEITIPKY
jgi:hypothetical protein